MATRMEITWLAYVLHWWEHMVAYDHYYTQVVVHGT